MKRYPERMSQPSFIDRVQSAAAAAKAQTQPAQPGQQAAPQQPAWTPPGRTLGRFEGIVLTTTDVAYRGTLGPIRGAMARVELGSDIGKRITATRLVMLGVFALAAKKKSGHVFLTVEGQGFQFAVEVPAKHEADARKFAAQVNTAARR